MGTLLPGIKQRTYEPCICLNSFEVLKRPRKQNEKFSYDFLLQVTDSWILNELSCNNLTVFKTKISLMHIAF